MKIDLLEKVNGHNAEFMDLESFTSLTPTIEELDKCNSKFYNKIKKIKSLPK